MGAHAKMENVTVSRGYGEKSKHLDEDIKYLTNN